MNQYFSEQDGTLYKEINLPFNSAVQVIHSQIPGLVELYDKIVDSMQMVYQPLDFYLNNGVCVSFKQSPSDEYYIKHMYEDESSVYVQLFGLDSDLIFPKYIQGCSMPHCRAVLTPAPEDAEGTNVFGPPNKCSRPGYDIVALVGQEPYVNFKTRDFELRLPGCITYTADYAIETMLNSVHRVWVANSPTFNEIMSVLPETVDVFLDDAENIYISGLPIGDERYVYQVISYESQGSGVLQLICDNRITPIYTPITLYNAAQEIQGDLWRTHNFGLPKSTISLMEVLL